MAPPWLAPESPDLVWFTGKDARSFLNDLISQEIEELESGETRRSLLLTPQGRLDYILWVVADQDRFGLMTDPGRGESLATTLGRYVIRVNVQVEREPGPLWVVVGDWEDGAGERFDISWPNVRRTLVVGERPDLPEGLMDDYERLRIEAVEPRWGTDVDDGAIPQETGLVPTSVDFTKGCFLGQELVARIDSRGGSAPRRLRLLVFDGDAPAPGIQVVHDERVVGAVTSVAGNLGLALLHRSVGPGDRVETAESAATVSAERQQ